MNAPPDETVLLLSAGNQVANAGALGGQTMEFEETCGAVAPVLATAQIGREPGLEMRALSGSF